MVNRKLTRSIVNWKMTFSVLAFIAVIVVYRLYIPFGVNVYKKGKQFYEQYQIRNSADKLTSKLNSIRKEITVIDSLLQCQEKRENDISGNMVDVLYSFADSSQFKTSKIETGECLKVLKHTETPVSVRGVGSYTALGKFTEKVENASWSTRIRQLVLKNVENGNVDAYVDFVVIE